MTPKQHAHALDHWAQHDAGTLGQDLRAAGAPATPGMAVTALAGEIIDALLADDKDGGYDLTAGLFGPAFSTLVRRWAAAEWAHKPQAQQASTASQVRPMSTAPRDGTVILVFVEGTDYGHPMWWGRPNHLRTAQAAWRVAWDHSSLRADSLLGWLPIPTYTGKAVR